jgi:hypothetical protein
MKKIFVIVSACLFWATVSISQNVGIGTATPQRLLHLKGDNEVLKIQGNYPWIGFTNNTDDSVTYDGFVYFPDTSLVLGSRFGTNMPVILAPNNVGLLYATASNNVGIGIASPSAKLHINGPVKLEGFNAFEFGGGVAGKEVNAGKIGYRTFTVDALDIVGAGSSTTDRKVKIYAEAGTTLTGPINIAGALQVFGNSGTAGQVLTSNGSTSPLWTNAAYGNTIRFSFDLLQTTVGANIDSMNFTATNYNLSPAQVFIVGANATRLQINKTGLYHFSGSVDLSYLNLTTATETGAYLDYYINNKAYPVDMGIALHVVGGGNHDYYKRFQFSFDVYLTAGQTLKFEKHFFPFSSGFSSAVGYVNGNLVAD